MKVKCMFDKVEYQSKPQGKEIAKITNRLEKGQVEIEVEELMNSLVKGSTFKPSLLNGKKEGDWMEAQLFALDFDENTTIETEINRCIELNILPAFVYTSFSHTEEHHKFRMVFCTEEPIIDYELARKLQLSLMNVFKNCDDKCKNLSRLYFGGKNLVYSNLDNRLDYEYIIDNYYIEECEEKKPRNNIDNTIIPLLSRGEKPLDDNYNLKALRNRDTEYLKKKIGNPHIVLENNQAFFDYIKGYDLGRLLEIKYTTSFRCIFHEDKNPSAGIFINEEGTYIYHCFSCGVSYNIINLIEKLGNFKSRPKAYKFIKDIFNLEINETEWQKEQKEILRENHRTLISGEFEKQCPTAYKNIKRNLKYLDQLFLIAEDNVYSEKLTDNEGNVVFFASNTYICDKLDMSYNSSIEVTKKNTLFAYHNLINKLDDAQIPEEMLSRSKAIGVNKNVKNEKRINIYSIPSYSTILFDEIETQGKKWNENNYTMKGLSREMFYRSEGKDVANKLYPQYKEVYDKNQQKVVNRTTTKTSDKRTEIISKIIFEVLNNKGYITEKEIAYLLIKNEICNKTTGEKQIKKSINEIILAYDLKRIRCNKEIKEQYKVDTQGYPFIIVKNE